MRWARSSSLENGKIKAEGDGEVQEMIDIADFAVGQSRMLYGKTMHSERAAHRMYEQWHPLGVVGVISAFNFPVAVWAWNAMLAAVCGNAAVWKPSPKTPLTALAVQSLANRVMSALSLPPIFTLAVADNAGTRALVADPRVALVSFTGSSAVGRDIATTVAGALRQVAARMRGQQRDHRRRGRRSRPRRARRGVRRGGHGGAALHDDAAADRARVPRASELLARLTAAYAQVRIGDPLEPRTLMGPLIDAAAVDNYRRRPSPRRRKAGGTLVCGGRVLPGSRATGSSRRSSRTRATTGRACSAKRSRRSST